MMCSLRSSFIGSLILLSLVGEGQDGKERELSGLYRSERFDRIIEITQKEASKLSEEAAFWRGMALKRKGAYDRAILFLKAVDKGPYGKRAKDELQASRKAIRWKQDPVCEVEPVRPLNSDADENCPGWGDATYTTLLFTRSKGKGREKGNDDLLITDKRQTGKWKKAVPFQKALNTPADEFCLSIDPNGSKGFFSRCEKGKCRTRILRSKDEGWEDQGYFDLLQPCAPDTVDHMQPAYHPSSQRLYFASDLPGGQGGMDLWYVRYDTVTGKWTDPVNAGPKVNSAGDEAYPTVRKDGRLYFSSDGHQGMGGMDLFRAERNGTGGHEKVENLGYPINSEADDTRIIFEGAMMRGFFSSDRERKGCEGKDDLFRFFKKT
ncbi:MAG: hypothetical protein ABEH38_06795 [Flavobacteriales bacterium]